MAEAMAGAWSDFVSPITEEEQKAFDEAMKQWVGVKYTPIAGAKQVVAGVNYCYICLAKAIVPGAPVTVAKLSVSQPLQGPIHITGVERVAP